MNEPEYIPGQHENDTVENRLKKTVFIVEATRAEQFFIWQDWAAGSYSPRYGQVNWKQLDGWIIKVGEIYKKPVNISVNFNIIEGQLIMFWYACSQMVDYKIIEKWLEENFKGKYDNNTRRASCDAANFCHCIHAIEEKIGRKLRLDISSRKS